MNAVYQGFLARTPDAVDACLHPDVTIWDSAHAPLVHGLGDLAALRATRTADGTPSATVAGIEASRPVIDVWGEFALLRHLLRVRFADGTPDQVIRNTSVWRKVGDRWLAVHNHEDVVPHPA